ncbi:MAG: LysR family glycine cleavage system transcriptional activator [Cryomorphaceae bacterium]|jgi:LysR family glycine cleavage system transcriptional activator
MTLKLDSRTLPSLNALRAFEAAARHLSFKTAAQELNVSQSAVSHQIKALEESLGLTLFIRRPREVELTLNGQHYYPILRDAFDRIADATELMLGNRSQAILTVQVYSTFTIHWLLPRLASFQLELPDIQVRLHTSQTNTDFHHESVDVAILIDRANNPTLRYDHLFDTQLFPVCSPDYLRKNGPIELPKDLKNHPLLQVFPSPEDWPNWVSGMQLEPFSYNSKLQLHMQSYNDALASAAQGLGVALGQQPYMDEYLTSGKLVEIFPEQRINNPNHWFLACRKEQADVAKIESFRAWLADQIASDCSLELIGEQPHL